MGRRDYRHREPKKTKRDAKQIKPITEAPPHVEVIKRKRANKSDENNE
ncbi:MAG: hypothetical protein J7J88_03660 [Dehalococcoidia bacterium]|nr:hypothetical protein [Dehalococcoidia bacterium]